MNVASPSLSPLWHKVASLRPQLRPQVDVVRHVARGVPWYVAYDQASNRSFRFSPAAYSLLMRLDGQRTVDEVWQALALEMDEHAPSQDDVLRLLGQLYLSDMLRAEGLVDADELTERTGKSARRKLLQRIQNPLFLRLPLLDPDRLLTASLPLVRPFLSPVGALLWLALMIWLGIQTGLHWEALTTDIAARVLALDSLLLMLLIFPVLKAIHELAHGYAVKLFGGQVHEVGVMFLVFLPIPYVEASASATFASKWQRAFVASAGMLAELVVAAGAMAVWIGAEPGLVSALAFNTMVLASVSTLVFNGNPLLRFDAYYILSDIIEVPNLATRANRYWQYLAKRYLFGLRGATNPVQAPGEGGWFVFYAPAALAYRIVVLMAIAIFVSTTYLFVGVVLAVWTVWLSLLWPATKAVRFILFSDALAHHRSRAILASTALIASALAALFMLPVPHGTVVAGIVRVPDGAAVALPVAGEVDALLVEDGATVGPGTVLARLQDPFLEARQALTEARLEEVRLRLRAAQAIEPGEVALYRQQEDFLSAQLAEIAGQQAGLEPISTKGGRLVLPASNNLVGRYAARGEVIGHVLESGAPVALVAVTQDRVDLVRSQTRSVALRPASDRFAVYDEARVLREVPGATRELPSSALARDAGGPIALVPGSDGRPRTIAPVFVFEIAADGLDVGGRVGERVHARFDHGASPLGPRLYRTLRQTFLRQFGV